MFMIKRLPHPSSAMGTLSRPSLTKERVRHSVPEADEETLEMLAEACRTGHLPLSMLTLKYPAQSERTFPEPLDVDVAESANRREGKATDLTTAEWLQIRKCVGTRVRKNDPHRNLISALLWRHAKGGSRVATYRRLEREGYGNAPALRIAHIRARSSGLLARIVAALPTMTALTEERRKALRAALTASPWRSGSTK
jgi:hypothetical protein